MADELAEEALALLVRAGRPDLADHVRAKLNRGRPERPDRQQELADIHLEMRTAVTAGASRRAVVRRFCNDPRVATVPNSKRRDFFFGTS